MVRIKHRYLLINILYPSNSSLVAHKSTNAIPDVVQFHAPTSDKFNAQVLARMIRDGVEDLFGDYGIGMISGNLKIVYLSAATSTAIVRVSRDYYRLVWASLAYVTRLPKPLDTPCVVQVVRNSGTIRKAEEEAIKRARDSVARAARAMGSDGSVGIDMLKEDSMKGPSTALEILNGDGDYNMSDSDNGD